MKAVQGHPLYTKSKGSTGFRSQLVKASNIVHSCALIKVPSINLRTATQYCATLCCHATTVFKYIPFNVQTVSERGHLEQGTKKRL